MSIPNTHFGKEYISSLLDGRKNLFFAGIGGVSMCSLAHISKLRGHNVSGYDRTPSKFTRSLESAGVTVYYDASAEHIDGVDVLIYTVAIPETNPEYARAKKVGIPCISRADYLGYIMSTYDKRIGVSGMHGKSTTTSMLESIYTAANASPTVSCGAVMKDVGSTHVIGSGDTFIFEACEYMDSFLDFYPTTAIILNIELDHVDYFKSMEQIRRSFANFAALTGDGGIVIANSADENVMRALEGCPAKIVTFGVGSPDADYNADGIEYRDGKVYFDLHSHGEHICRTSVAIPGEHYVWDAVAAIAAAAENGIPISDALRGIEKFGGAARRMEYCGKTDAGASVYTDYAHHPTELTAALATARHMGHRRIVCVFQPHTYSRTAEFIDDFAAALSAPFVSEVIVNDIYAARETDTKGMSASLLVDKIKALGQNAQYIPDFGDIADHLRESFGDGDMLLIIGAGDINAVVRML